VAVIGGLEGINLDGYISQPSETS